MLSREKLNELHELVELLCEQRATELQVARLQELVKSDRAALRFYVDYLELHAQFMWRSRWSATAENCKDLSAIDGDHNPCACGPEEGLAFIASLGEAAPTLEGASSPLRSVDVGSRCPTGIAKWAGQSRHLVSTWGSKLITSRLAALAAMLVVALVTARIAYFRTAEKAEPTKAIAKAEPAKRGTSLPSPATPQHQSPYSARLVNVTNCRWDSGKTTANLGGDGLLSPGQALYLLEGVAGISSALPRGGMVQFQLEGPLAMMLTSDGNPSLLSGKLAALVSCDFGNFALVTPLGRVVVDCNASIGVDVTASTVELHVFSGEASIEPLFTVDSDGEYDPTDLTAIAGTSLSLCVNRGQETTVTHGKADRNAFVSKVSMVASQLNISEAYVSAVRDARPIAYWRFEDDSQGIVRNEMGDHLHCRVAGSVRWRSYQGNRAAELGSTTEAGCFVTDDAIGTSVGKTYSVEAWIKPSHWHHGAIFSLIARPRKGAEMRQGLLFELCGNSGDATKSAHQRDVHPGRIRLVHRNPLESHKGNSCYSDRSSAAYALRKWQHLAAVKSGNTIKLYVDGRVVARETNATALVDGMKVLIGQLMPPHRSQKYPVRPYVGEIDEVAFYDRTLSREEITRHVQLGEAKQLVDSSTAGTSFTD